MTTYVFAGGGTGGHIFPALAIAEHFATLDPGSRWLVACSDRPLDSAILERARAERVVTPAKPFGLRPKSLARFVRSWGPSVRQGRGILREARAQGPVVLLSMGGFVAAPYVQAARAERVPVLLVNLDAVPGKANRWISKRAQRVVTVADVEGWGEWERIPPIVRTGAKASASPQECRAALGLDPESLTLLVTGGSQGAESVNALVQRLLETVPDAFAGWQVVHQCGKASEPVEAALERAYVQAGVPARVSSFIHEMGVALGASDLVLGRSGAGTVAEVWANGVPAIFLPYPYHQDEHQRANARPLEQAGGALVVTDLIDPQANATAPDGAGMRLMGLLRDQTERARMRACLHKLGPADGAERVARLACALAGGTR